MQNSPLQYQHKIIAGGDYEKVITFLETLINYVADIRNPIIKSEETSLVRLSMTLLLQQQIDEIRRIRKDMEAPKVTVSDD